MTTISHSTLHVIARPICNSRLVGQIQTLLKEMDGAYNSLTDKLSEATVSPETMDKPL